MSDVLSPAAIVLGRHNVDFSTTKIEFGAHVMVYTTTDNTMKERSIPSIALRPSNDAGGYYFMSLYTGEKIHAYHWTEVPIDKGVIDRVEELAYEEK